MSLQVSWGCAGCRVGATSAERNSRERCGVSVTPSPGNAARLGLSTGAAAAGGPRSRGPSAVTPRQAHPFASAPIAGSWRGYQLLTTSHTSHGNSEPWGVVRRTAGTGPGEGLRQAARREHTSSAPPDPPILEREVRAVSISPAPLAPWFVQYLSQARDL